jgi:hypothetical protein
MHIVTDIKFIAWLRLVLYFQRRRGAAAGLKSSKCKTEQKPVLFDSSSGSSRHSKRDKDDDFEPPALAVRTYLK